jgi:hypothetical protein
LSFPFGRMQVAMFIDVESIARVRN